MNAYPIAFAHEPDGAPVARLVDFPYTHASADDPSSVVAELYHQFQMIAAERMAESRKIPAPSEIRAASELLVIGQMDAAKIALYHIFLDAGLSRFELARRMGIEAKEIYRLFDLRQPVSVSRLERAAAALGRRLVISLVDP